MPAFQAIAHFRAEIPFLQFVAPLARKGIQSQRITVNSIANLAPMAAHRSKPHQLKLSETSKPHALAPQDWHTLTAQGIARIESDTPAARIAVLRLPYVGWLDDGVLCVSRIGASIKSTWIAWEREWLQRVKTSDLYVKADGHLWQRTELGAQHPQAETFAEREARVYRERDAEAFIESLDWQTNRQKKNRNRLRWVSEEQLREVLTAFGRSDDRIID